jgi:transposase
VGFVTAEVILSELGDVSRFRNAKAVCAYAGLVPVVKQSGGKRSKDLCISKQGSGLLRFRHRPQISQSMFRSFAWCEHPKNTSGPTLPRTLAC